MSEDQDFLRELQKEFLDELQFLLEACEESYLKIEQPENRADELAKIFRLAHSIKGAGAAVGFNDLSEFAHTLEDCLVILRSRPELVDTETISILLKSGDAIKKRIEDLRQIPPPAWDISILKAELKAFTQQLDLRRQSLSGDSSEESALPPEFIPIPLDEPPVPRGETEPIQKVESYTVKVDSNRVDTLLNLVGELVVLKSQILNESHKVAGSKRLNTVVGLLDKTIRELQDKTLGMRMTPLKSLFLKTQRIARDLSVRLRKPIDVVLEGEDIEIDRTMVEQISDPLMHLVRNCVDHGIESPEKRQAAGKPERGLIKITAQQVGGRVLLRIGDDGGGIPRDRVIQKAITMKLLDASADIDALSDATIFDLLFMPGFSTAEKVTDISGRGVGMNVVRENLEHLKGRIEVESTLGKGTAFKLSIPLTTSITDGMLISVEGQTYILPIDGIRELVNLGDGKVVRMHSGDQLLNMRGKFYPFLHLADFLRSSYHTPNPGEAPKRTPKDMVVLYEVETGIVALEVNAVIGQTQVVMKPLAQGVRDREGIAGAAILGDGKVALLLDVNGIVTGMNRTLPLPPDLRA